MTSFTHRDLLLCSTDALDQLGGMDDLMGNPFPSSNDLIDLARGHMGMGDEYEL